MRFRPKCDRVRAPFVRALPAEGRSVAEGGSAKRILYSAAKRPSSQNPNCVAIAVTVVAAGPASRKARLTRCIRRRSRNRIGPIPICSWQHRRNVRSDTPIIRQICERYRASSGYASSTRRNRRMTSSCRRCAERSSRTSPPPRQATMASIKACSRPRADSGLAMISGAVSAKCPAAACSRWSLAIAASGAATNTMSRAGVRSHPAIAPTETISSTGSDMAPKQADPDER